MRSAWYVEILKGMTSMMRDVLNLSGEVLHIKTNDGHEVKINAPITDELDRLIGALSLVVLEARGFSRENKRRLAQFIYAAGEMVSERTRIDTADQTIFEAALRDVAARKYG